MTIGLDRNPHSVSGFDGFDLDAHGPISADYGLRIAHNIPTLFD
jgi:hypothetical protein